MKLIYLLFLSLTLLSYSLSAQAVKLTPVISGISSPLGLENCGDGRLFIVSRGGKIMVADSNYAVAPLPFLDISSLITVGDEKGLLGLAFHPDFKNNGYFYITYTRQAGPQLQDVVARYSVSVADSNRADSLSGEVLISINDPYPNHNGGSIKFGPDGYLYVAFGDGGSRDDPQKNGQNVNVLLGKIVRIDVNTGSPYGIPADNPFVGMVNHREEIWAYGVRNPWRFSFDRMTGDLWIADVGQDHWEEIDFQPANAPGGRNYGWICYEGDSFVNLDPNCPPADSNLHFPDYVYSHLFNGDCSITGGYVYRGTTNADLYGKYLFTDYCSGLIRAFDITDSSVTDLLNGPNETMSSFGQDSKGELYICDLVGGNIWRIDKNFVGISGVPISDFSISPNPSGGMVIISHPGNVEISRVEIHDIAGRVIAVPLLKTNDKNITVNLPEEKGLYFIRIKTSTSEYTQKVVRE